MIRTVLTVFFVVLSLVFLSCTSAPPEQAPHSQPIQKEVPAPPPAPPVKPVSKPVSPSKTDSAFTLDKETYTKTKEDISRLIAKLNTLIEDRDYTTWLTYLSKNYYDYYSDPKVLKEQSDSPLLKKYKITLRSLKDYFNYVVVGSRKNVRLDEIKALDANHIKAYMYIDSTPVIIYELVKIKGQWKIAHFQD